MKTIESFRLRTRLEDHFESEFLETFRRPVQFVREFVTDLLRLILDEPERADLSLDISSIYDLRH